MSGNGDYCLKWNDHHNVFFSTAEELCGSNILCDVSLSAGDKIFQAHKLVLSVCSPYFKRVFAVSDRSVNTIIHMKNVDSRHLELILAYMYRGELTLKQSELIQFLATAKDLQVKGLSEMDQVEAAADLKQDYRKENLQPENLKRKPDPHPTDLHKPNQKHLKTETTSSYHHPSPIPMLHPLHQLAPPHHLQQLAHQLRDCVGKAPDSPQLPPASPTNMSAPVNLRRPSNKKTEGDDVDVVGDRGGGEGGGPLLVDEHVIPEDDDLSNLSMGDVQNVKYEESELSESQDLTKQTSTNLTKAKQRLTSGPGISNTKIPPVQASTKPFQCGMCEMAFDQKWLLKRHYRTHTKERPFRCMLCMKNFSLKDSCVRHIRNVHREEIYGGASVSDISSSYCQYDESGGSIHDKDDLEIEMGGNEALAVAM